MKRAAVFGLVGGSLVVYTVLAVLAHLHRYFGVDLAVTLALQGFRSTALDALMAAISWPGYFPEFVPEFAVLLLVLYRLRLKVEAIIMSLAELGVGAMGFAMKPIVGRPRPTTGLVWVNDRLSSDPYSFTAGHVHTFVVIFGYIAYLAWTRMKPGGTRRRLVIAGCALVLFVVGIARVYLGDHWLSDVVGGYFAGAIWLGLAILADMWWRSRSPAPRRRVRPKAA